MAVKSRRSVGRRSAVAGVVAAAAVGGAMLFPTRPADGDATATRPATTRATTAPERPIYDVPRLGGIAVDGDPADWTDRGFAVAVLDSSPRRLPADQFDAQVRLGWDDRGLLVLADVTDPDVREADTDMEILTGSSVEVVVDARHGVEHVEADLSPGVDPRHPQRRSRLTDDRSGAHRAAVPLTVTAAARKTAGGYVLEALMPWKVLSVDPKIGTEVGLQVRVNRPVNGRVTQLTFLPRQIRLADHPSKPVTTVIDAGYERFRRTRFSVATTADAAGRMAEVKAGDVVLCRGPLVADGRMATTQMAVPMPPLGKPYKAVVATLAGVRIGPFSLGNADDDRRAAAVDLNVAASSSVFTTTAFPAIDFVNPGAADNLIGNYTVQPTFYDREYQVVTTADRPGRYGAIVKVTPEVGKPFKKFLSLYRGERELNFRPLPLRVPLQLPGKFGIDPAVAREQASANGAVLGELFREARFENGTTALYLSWLAETPPAAGDLPRRLGPFDADDAWWYDLRKQTGNSALYKYLVHQPDPKSHAADAKFPLILFLHGSGQRGSSVDAVKANGLPKVLKNEADWPYKNQFIVVSPQCPANQDWSPLMLRDLLDAVMAKYPVDPDRVYLTGLSMGGFGTWDLAEYFPDRFAAIAPVCGGGDPADAGRIKDVPTWVFHGGRDPTVKVECAYEMVQALRDLHGRVRFTVYPDYGHDSWEPAYDDHALYDWFLQQRRGHPAQPRAVTPDTRPAAE